MLKDYFSPIFSYYLELLLAITRNISRSEMRLSRCDSACATQLYVDKNCYWIIYVINTRAFKSDMVRKKIHKSIDLL